MSKQTADTRSLDLLWGAEAMAPVINQTPRQVLNLLARGVIPARRIGRRWCIKREALMAVFTDGGEQHNAQKAA